MNINSQIKTKNW